MNLNLSHGFSTGRCLPALAIVVTLLAPGRIAHAQNLFVSNGVISNTFLGVIDEFTPNGTESTFASGLQEPRGLAFNANGDLFVADQGSNTAAGGSIYEFTPNGTQSTFATGLNNPLALAFNSNGDLFEADYGSGDIYEFTPNGTKSFFAASADLENPLALAFNSSGDLFVSGAANIVWEFTTGGSLSAAVQLHVDRADGLAFDSSGNLFVSSRGGIYELAGGQLTASPTLISSTAGGPLAFDSSGDLFEGYSSGNIYEFTPSGVQSTFTSGLFEQQDGVAGLAFDPVPEPGTLALLATVFASASATARVYRRAPPSVPTHR